MSEFPRRVRAMLDRGRLQEQTFTPVQIAQLWKKAVESAKDAELPDLSVDGALRAAYQAGHTAVLALLAAHGLRTGSGRGHHEGAFAGAAALEHEGLDDLVVDSSEIRGLRQSSLYDPTIAGKGDREHAIAWMRRTLPAIREALVTVDPELASRTENYPKASESSWNRERISQRLEDGSTLPRPPAPRTIAPARCPGHEPGGAPDLQIRAHRPPAARQTASAPSAARLR